MSNYAADCRREAAEAREQAAQATDGHAKRILEEVAHTWEVLAAYAEWLGLFSSGEAMQQQEQPNGQNDDKSKRC
jgi:hypothetical protein